jgi:hypothetical protein
VGVTSYDSEAVGREASRIIGKGWRNEEQNVVFPIKGQVEDKEKGGMKRRGFLTGSCLPFGDAGASESVEKGEEKHVLGRWIDRKENCDVSLELIILLYQLVKK